MTVSIDQAAAEQGLAWEGNVLIHRGTTNPTSAVSELCDALRNEPLDQQTEEGTMSSRDVLARVLQSMPEDRVREVLDFAEFLQQKDTADWRRFGQGQLANAYGPDEPEYSLADLKRETRS